MNRVHRDSLGVEGLPVTLMVTMVVLAITIPMIFGSFRAYDRGRVESTLVAEIGDLSSTVQHLYISGPGNSALVEFNALRGSLTGIEYIIIGDEPAAANASIIRFKLQGRPEAAVGISSPSVPITSADNSSFSFASGTFLIKAECVLRQGQVPETIVMLRMVQ